MKDSDKLLRKFSAKERGIIVLLVERIVQHGLEGLDCKKLKGYRNLFRVRKGNIRIIFELTDKDANILTIERRGDTTYNL